MKRIIASIGLVAMGASSLQAQYAPGLSAAEKAKPWSVSGSLRGFYDDNFVTQVKSRAQDSWGLEVSPSATFNHSAEQTFVSASYVYDLKWYEKPDITDQTHQFNAKFDHKFTERYSLNASDSFVVAQEPNVIDPGAVATPLRVSGNNIRNTGNISLLTEVTSVIGVDISYANTVYSYSDDARAALLDRMEHLAGLDLRWKALPETVGVLGYHYSDVGYSDKQLTVDIPSDIRNSRSHFFLVGVDQTFSPELTGSLRVGAQYFDYYNVDKNQTSPYADAKLSYTYREGSYVQAGVKHLHNATDQIGDLLTAPVLDQESTVPYLALTHKITPSLTGSLLGQFQHSTFNGGNLDNQVEDFYTLSANLAYQFNPFLMAEAGYSFDDLSSDVGRGYKRNRVYLGVRATY